MSSISVPTLGRSTLPARGLRDRLRAVADAAVSPLTVDDVLDHFHPLRREPGDGMLRGRVVEVRPETAESATLVIKPGKGWRGHLPGQYVRLGVDVDGVRLWRTYSLTHGPGADRNISITVKAMPDGAVSQHLVRRIRPGTLLHLDHPAGDFVLPQPLPSKLLMVTAGSGITPVIGMLRNLFLRATPVEADIVLVSVNQSESAAIFRDELREHAEAGHITLIERYDDRDGLLDVGTIDALVPDFAERLAYACGPVGLLDALEQHHADRGLALTTERFRPVVLAAGPDNSGGTVAFEQSGTDIELDGATPILDVAESADVLMPSGCRMGICMGCVIPLKEGSVRDLRNGAITSVVPGETGALKVQTCINAAAGDCHIDH